jgi:hypothetical protein
MIATIPLLFPYVFKKWIGNILRIILDLSLFEASETQQEEQDQSRV